MAARLGPLGADAAGGDQRRFRGFEREPWFNVHQVDGVAIAPPTPPSPSEAARAVIDRLATWRARGGPALIHGGIQAHWRITLPSAQAFADYDGLSGLDYYAGTLAHEHIHASGSRGRFHLATALRPDHAQSVASWMSVLGDRSRQQVFFWAVREAEQAVEYVTRLGDVSNERIAWRVAAHLRSFAKITHLGSGDHVSGSGSGRAWRSSLSTPADLVCLSL